MYVKRICLLCRHSFFLLYFPQFSYQQSFSQLAMCSCSPLLPLPAPWSPGGSSLQLSIQMFLLWNERVEQSGYTEEGWASSPLFGMNQGPWIWQLWSKEGKHETLLSDQDFAKPSGPHLKVQFTNWKFHSLSSCGLSPV